MEESQGREARVCEQAPGAEGINKKVMIQGERYKSTQIIGHNSTPAPYGQK